MYTIALIAFRESLEMFLILVPLIAYLAKVNKRNLTKYIYWGSSTGFLLSAILGTLLYGKAQSLAGYSKNLFEGSILLIVAGLILYNLIIIGSKKTKSFANIEEDYNVSASANSLFILAFLTVFRESLEIIMFGLPMFNVGALNIGISLVLGVLASSLITIVIYRTSLKLNIGVLFSIITLVLIFIGSLMFGEGIAELTAIDDEAVIGVGRIVYAVPCLYFFIKNITKSYIKKKK
jgi:high-affinity iron transporter